MDTHTIITLVQQKIGITNDGIAGPVTWKALYKNIFNEDAGTKNLLSVIKAVQKEVGTAADGVAGTHPWKAIFDHFFTTAAAPQEAATTDTSEVDDRSEKCIA